MQALADLWNGRLPLAEAFWKHAVLIGMAINVAATAGMLAAVSAGLPGLVGLAIHLSPLPYVIVCTVGVWRSTTQHQGSPHTAELARVAVLVWAGLLVLI
jgi:hypothetical protein